jgi:hypothetical protein
VRPLAVARVGLKRANSLGHDFSASALRATARPASVERTVNVSHRFRGCQSTARNGVCYSRRLFRPIRPAANPCSFGLSPKFSTPVEKTVEKPLENRSKPVCRRRK